MSLSIPSPRSPSDAGPGAAPPALDIDLDRLCEVAQDGPAQGAPDAAELLWRTQPAVHFVAARAAPH